MSTSNLSDNSVFKSDVDLCAKYSKLAAEYSKVRAQNTVLKKAIVEEQTKTQQLNETLREKDQMIRKINQETESLNFRNSQLARRVTVLQEEMDVPNKSGKKKNKNTNDASNSIGDHPLLNEEIKKTMIENAKLLSQLKENEEKHNEEVAALKIQINALTGELDQCNLRIKQMLRDQELVAEQYTKDNRELRRDYVNKKNKLKETEVELSTIKNAHKSYIKDVGPKLEITSHLLSKKVPFLDEKHEALNKLNVRTTQTTSSCGLEIELLQNRFKSLILTFYNIINNVTLELKQLGFEELKIYIKTLLKEDDGLLLHEKLNACSQLLAKIGLQCNAPETVEYTSYQFIEGFLNICSSLYLSYLNESHQNAVAPSSKDPFMTIRNELRIFQRAKNDLVQKIIGLPNCQPALIQDEFNNLDIAMSNVITQVENIDTRRAQNGNVKHSDPYEFKKKAADYLRSLKKDVAERISYEEALKNSWQLQEYRLLNNVLKEELKNLENALTILEQEKIHLLNDKEISNIKFKDSITVENVKDEMAEVTNELGKFVCTETISAEVVAREKEILRHMNKTIDEMIIKRENACSRARMFGLECKALQRRAENYAIEKRLVENDYLKSNRIVLALKEELNTVSKNYETQLSTMSEHLASVNEKLALQNEEIDHLKYQLSNKISKWGKAR